MANTLATASAVIIAGNNGYHQNEHAATAHSGNLKGIKMETKKSIENIKILKKESELKNKICELIGGDNCFQGGKKNWGKCSMCTSPNNNN